MNLSKTPNSLARRLVVRLVLALGMFSILRLTGCGQHLTLLLPHQKMQCASGWNAETRVRLNLCCACGPIHRPNPRVVTAERYSSMIGDSSGLFPHFLGILSKTPPHAHADAANSGSGDVPHPFTKNVPSLKRHGANPPTTGGYGGKVFSGGSDIKVESMPGQPPVVDHSDGQRIDRHPGTNIITDQSRNSYTI